MKKRKKSKKAKRPMPAKKKVAKKKPSRPAKKVQAKAVAGVTAEVGSVAQIDSDDPIGACYWLDNTGQNRCEVTTKSLCQKKANSTFRLNKQCSGGV